MPAYLTQAEYVQRFGEEELIRLTDAEGLGSADAYTFDDAVTDASGDIDAYLAKRYALPLAAVPPTLKSVAAALVREKLHLTFPTDTVTRSADRARQTLRDFSSGAAVLVGADGVESETGSQTKDGITYSAPVRVFSSDALARF